jgi:hypothetical protein
MGEEGKKWSVEPRRPSAIFFFFNVKQTKQCHFGHNRNAQNDVVLELSVEWQF